MNALELRSKYIEFFVSKGHVPHPSGSLVPYDVTGKLDESLLFNGAGMVQFKPYFRGIAEPPAQRLTNSQKCVRTGDIDEVGDLTHLTFFEMLGNFSFGDYFKTEAIDFSWEFMTSPKWLGLDPKRLSFTVFEIDDEAFGAWAKHVESIGYQPESRIFRLDEETNYWPAGAFTNGPPGPCGPNSEMFYWTPNDEPPPGDGYTKDDYLRDEKLGKWLEIWNDVFIQFEWQGHLKNPERPKDGYLKTGMPELPFKSIDTGMGLERTACVLGGFKSVYDTDVFTPILSRIESVSGGKLKYGKNEASDRIFRVIADHIRTACFCIADGVLPGNSGRGYVLRRLIRRAVLKGQRGLGFEKPFFHLVYDGVVEAMGNHYMELLDRRDVIIETLQNEERLFRRTLSQGSEMLANELDGVAEGFVLEGSLAFKLYDTYGFPLEVTQELCAERGVKVDVDGYEVSMSEAQERSRGASQMETVYGGENESLLIAVSEHATPITEFVGYQFGSSQSEIAQISPRFGPDKRTLGEFQVSLLVSPFYAESGGQVGDTGLISCPDFEFEVLKTWKEGGLIWHDVHLRRSRLGTMIGLNENEIQEIMEQGFFFQKIHAEIDLSRRKRIMRNHTATHLLHAALRTVLGKHVTQAGSMVAPDHLRFDFTHGRAIEPDQLEQIERMVQDHLFDNQMVETLVDVPINTARSMGAMALFGEKYGDKVRVVRIGEFSTELCGGTHVGSTAEILFFKVLSEASAASGIRRIEAITGEAAHDWALEQNRQLRHAAKLLKTQTTDLIPAIERSLDHARDLQKKLEKQRSQELAKQEVEWKTVGAIELGVMRLNGGEVKDAQAAADRAVPADSSRVVVIGVAGEEKVGLAAKVGSAAQSAGAHAGSLLRELAKIVGGGGGGRPDFATAGGKDASRLDEAMAAAESVLKSQLGATS